ncbi:MAG TPA: TssQ family T6SS-associated lipoprotein [Usitatibacter sp.]|nr:TssQ family T6SS-associated lipoprotein [Usitatibacter sp.]
MNMPLARPLLVLAAVLALAGCEQLGTKEKPQPVAPQITEEVLRKHAQDSLAAGVKEYDAADYAKAESDLNEALAHGLLPKTDQSHARKLLAFIYCTSNREAQCRDEFRKAFEIDPDFSLTPAEDGHPIWGPVYRDVRTQLITEREAATTVGKQPTLTKAQQMLSDGMVKYDAGEYSAARRLLEAAITEGFADKANQVKAMKYIAFTDCLERRYKDCRAQFIKIYDVDPNFDLTPAEAGNPYWTHTFAGAKATAKRQLAEKAAKEARAAKDQSAKDKKATSPAAASVPQK